MAIVSRRAIVREIVKELAAADIAADRAAIMTKLAAYMVDTKSAGDAALYINDIAEELFRQTGRLVVEVTSAHPLTGEVRQELTAFLIAETGASAVDMQEFVDDSLIGGFIARTPMAEFDMSVRHTLRQLTAAA